MDKDKRAQFPAYPRRGVLKAGVLIGVFTGLAVVHIITRVPLLDHEVVAR
jgi:hypothetical protein